MNDRILRPLVSDDLPARAKWLNDPITRAGMPLEGEFSVTQTIAWYARVAGDPGRIDLALDFRHQVVAMGGLTDIRLERRAELYAFVSPEEHGLGHGRSLVQGLCSLAFTTLRLHRLYLWTYATNIAAQRLYADCGFRVEGQLRDHAEVEGNFVDRIVMGLLAPEWEDPGSGNSPRISNVPSIA